MSDQQPSGPQRPGTQPKPTLRPTNPATLVVTVLALAVVSWLAIVNFYGDIPPLPWLPPATLFGLAAIEALAARATKARIDRRPGTVPVEPLLVARYAVLAKASSMVGAIFTGVYAGVLVYLLTERGRLSHAADDLPAGATGLGASIVLMGAALWLEHSCRVPKRPEDEQNGG